jgi:hypothetical protein
MAGEGSGKVDWRSAVSGYVVAPSRTPAEQFSAAMHRAADALRAGLADDAANRRLFRFSRHRPVEPQPDPLETLWPDGPIEDAAMPLKAGPDILPEQVIPAPRQTWIQPLRNAASSLRAMPMPETLPPARALAAPLAGLGLLLALPLALMPPAAPDPSTDSTPAIAAGPAAPLWRDVIRPIAVFNLEAPDMSTLTLDYSARVRTDGAREDVLSWSTNAASEPVAVVGVHRHPPVEVTEQRLYSELARRAATFGFSIDASGAPVALATKFGDLEVLDIQLTGRQGAQACIGFRHVAWSAPLAITGWRCGSAGKPVDRPSLICFVDRLDILSAGQELWLRDYFAESERYRSFCATRRSSTGRKPRWDEADAAVPKLKPEVTGTVKKKAPQPKAAKPKAAAKPRAAAAKPAPKPAAKPAAARSRSDLPPPPKLRAPD